MTPRERLVASLRGEWGNKVPFVAYADQLPRSETARRLRNGGLCLVDRQVAVHRVSMPGVQHERRHFEEDRRPLIRTVYRTEAGELSEVEELGPDAGRWHVERLFKGPQDYAALRALYAAQQFEPDYEAFLRRQDQLGEDFLLKPEIGYSPLHQIMYWIMGIEQFAQEWSERRDEVLDLYQVLVDNRRRLYPVVAASPALLATYCGNLSPEVIGLKRFQEYYRPHYDEFADIMHDHGKLTSTLFDAGTWLLEEEIGLARLDCVEGFSPEPDGDMTVAQARTVWHDKVLWTSVPRSAYLHSAAKVEVMIRQLLRESASGIRFIIGAGDNLPGERWAETLLAVIRAINAEGGLPPP